MAFCFLACKNENNSAPTDKKAPIAAKTNKYTITPFSQSETFPTAFISNMKYKDGKFDFEVEGYELGAQTADAKQKMCANSGKGQHIHLIVDNKPYAAKYVSDFDYEIADGEHYLLAFLSRSYHESIKTDKAHVASKINVKDNSIDKIQSIDGPMLFYSRPKGKYVGKENTDKVMLDFYPINAKLGSDYKVMANINGEKHSIDKWQPYYVEGLPMGENTIELTLLDANNNIVDAPLNPVTRKFTLLENEIPSKN